MKLEDFKKPNGDVEKDLERLRRIINILKKKRLGNRVTENDTINKEIKEDEDEHIS